MKILDNNSEFKTIGGYPSPFVSNEEKLKPEYGLQYFKKMYSDWDKSSHYNYADKRKTYNMCRQYAEGNQGIAKYKDLLDVQGDSSYMNIDWTPVSIIPKFVDVICGEMINQEYEIKASAIDPVSEDKKKKDESSYRVNMMNKDHMKRAGEIMGGDFSAKGFTPENEDELNLYMNLNYKQAHEIALEQGIEFVLNLNDFKETRKRIIRDLVVVGQAALKTYIDPSTGVKVKYVDPENLITSYTTSPDFKDIKHVGEIYSVTIGELKRIAGDQFTDEQYEEIAESYGKKPKNTEFQGFSATGMYGQEYDRFSVQILDAEFITTYDVNYEKKQNIFGGYSVRKRKSNYEPSKKSKTKREKVNSTVKIVYSGKYIVGTDYIFDYGLAKNMMRPKSNLAETKLSYMIYAPNIRDMKVVSLCQRMIPFADQIQLAHLKLQHVLAKARPKGAAFEIGALENVSKGDGGTFTPLELQEIYDQTGNIYYRRLDDDGAQTSTMPIQELENGIGREMMQLIQVYNHNLQLIRDVTGINEVREGAKPSSEALVGIQKLQLLASNNATRQINEGYLNIVKSLGECVSMRLQDIFQFKKPLKGYTSALGSNTIQKLKKGKDLSIYDFGITLEVAPDEQEKQILEQNIQMSISQKELRIEDAILIRGLKNVKLANQMLILRRKKYQEELTQQAQKNSQMQAQQQQQATMAASQGRQQEEQVKAQLEQVKMKAKLQSEQELLKLEYKLKADFEKQMHQFKMEQMSLANEGKVDANEVMGESRQKSIESSAQFQSKMIEQRKGQGGIIGSGRDKDSMYSGRRAAMDEGEEMRPQIPGSFLMGGEPSDMESMDKETPISG